MDRELFPYLVDISRNLAEVLGCPATELLPMNNVTTGMNTVLRSWQRRRRLRGVQTGTTRPQIVCLGVAYGSTKKLLRSIAEEDGLEIVEVPVRFPLDDEEDLLEALTETLTGDTELVILDHIPSNAPIILPVDRAVDICRENAPDAFVVIDAAHSLLGTTLDLKHPLGDALVTNCHKWFCGPKGTAVLHVAPEHHAWVEPLVISHGYGADFVSGFYWPGLADFSSWLALDAVLAFWDAVGIDQARNYSHSVARDAAEELADAWGTGLGAPAYMFGPMVLVELPALPALSTQSGNFEYAHAEAVQNSLFRKRIEVPVKALSGRLFVRISAHIYSEMSDYEPLRDAVLELASGAEI
eukprot:TRINITY_DN43244_c0_g1_i1.p1 TRINITY_DN43244_c0_g1~~TRINITY_DN43244_c0_g1_i1.p1  ORF type:complete len:355 (-),score=46.60 TRINITY_DN43244_c0_g1_i1:304-1368(-)